MPAARVGSSTYASSAPEVCTAAWPAYRRSCAATSAMASSGTVTKMRSTSLVRDATGTRRGRRAPAAEARLTARVAGGDRHHRPAGVGEGDTQRTAHATGADEADARMSARVVGWMRMTMAGDRRASRSPLQPIGPGGGRILVPTQIRPTRGGHSRQEPTSRARPPRRIGDRLMASVSSSPADGARASLAAGDARGHHLPARRGQRPARPAALLDQGAARERAAQLRRRHGHAPRTCAQLAAWQPSGGARGRDPVHARRASCCRTSPACPAVVDLAAMRAAMARLGGDPQAINPLVPVDLVIDHSVQVDHFGTADALRPSTSSCEFERNRERYAVPAAGASRPSTTSASCRRAPASCTRSTWSTWPRSCTARGPTASRVAYPDTLVGTDSPHHHDQRPRRVGWGVGGIEAEAVMLGQPVYMLHARRGRRSS